MEVAIRKFLTEATYHRHVRFDYRFRSGPRRSYVGAVHCVRLARYGSRIRLRAQGLDGDKRSPSPVVFGGEFTTESDVLPLWIAALLRVPAEIWITGYIRDGGWRRYCRLRVTPDIQSVGSQVSGVRTLLRSSRRMSVWEVAQWEKTWRRALRSDPHPFPAVPARIHAPCCERCVGDASSLGEVAQKYFAPFWDAGTDRLRADVLQVTIEMNEDLYAPDGRAFSRVRHDFATLCQTL